MFLNHAAHILSLGALSTLFVLGSPPGCEPPDGGDTPTPGCDSRIWYSDLDGDSFGDPATAVPAGCEGGIGLVNNGLDCDDTDPAVNPDAYETASTSFDDDCDGVAWDHGAVEVTGDCTLDEFVQPTDNTTRLRILGQYGDEDGGPARVYVDQQEPTTLVLNSYESMDWVVTERIQGTVKEVIFSGYHDVTVDAPEGVTITELPWTGSTNQWDDYETRELVAEAEALTGLVVDSFHGCYQGTSFVVSEGDDLVLDPAYPLCDGDSPEQDEEVEANPEVVESIPGCEAVVSESGYCLTTEGHSVVAFGLDSGSSCRVVEGGALSASTLTWRGDYLYGCDGEYGMLSRTSLVTGQTQKSYVYCGGVVSLGDDLVTLPTRYEASATNGMVFEGFADAQCEGPSTTFSAPERQESYGSFDDVIYGAWHAGDEVLAFGYPDSDLQEVIPLEGYDNWILGLAVLDEETLIINTTWPEGGYRVHNLTTGALIRTLPSSTRTAGLACISN